MLSINKNKLIEFYKFLKKDNNIDKDNIFKDILIYYDNKNKLIDINTTNLNNLITKYNKQQIINKLSVLFRSNQIEYPYLCLYIDVNILKNIINALTIFNDKNFNINDKITKKDIYGNNKFITILYTLDDLIDIKLIDDIKNNINYFIINYFAENDILKCKRKKNFISPYDLIYSKNNYLETLFDSLITNDKYINSQNIKTFIKKNIAFCSNNNVLDLLIIFNLLYSNNNTSLNIINIGLDWGEWTYLAYILSNYKFYSYYCNNLNEDTKKNIKKNLNFNTKNLVENLQININYQPKEYSSVLFDILFVNLDFLFNYLAENDDTINDEIIFSKYINPNIINNINTKYIILKLNSAYNKLNIFKITNKKIKNRFNYIIDNSLYIIFNIDNN
jgi:hypothetical protein